VNDVEERLSTGRGVACTKFKVRPRKERNFDTSQNAPFLSLKERKEKPGASNRGMRVREKQSKTEGLDEVGKKGGEKGRVKIHELRKNKKEKHSESDHSQG